MIKTVIAPKPALPQALAVPYMYAACLGVLAIVMLMGVGGFDFAHIKYQTPGSPIIVIIIAALSIYALPFLAQLRLSPLARYFSALFSLVAPLFVLGYVAYLLSENLISQGALALGCSLTLLLLGTLSFTILDGRRALSFPKK